MNGETTADCLSGDAAVAAGSELDQITRQMAENVNQASAFIKALANSHRILILCVLTGSKGEMSVSEIEVALNLRQPTLSQQLARLREDGLVATRRDGKSIYYRLDCNRAGIVMMLLYEWFCRDQKTT